MSDPAVVSLDPTTGTGHPKPLKVAVIGAGIGGLTAAIGLRRQGHIVHVYEKAEAASEVGAALHLAPNSNGILRRWGVFADKFGACTMSFLRQLRQDGSPFMDVDISKEAGRWQHPWHLVHRAALHDELKKVAVDSGVLLHVSRRVVGADPAAGRVEFRGGMEVTADVILGADGIYSVTRKHTHDGDIDLFSTGKAAFRFLLDRDVLGRDIEAARIMEQHDCLTIWFGADRRVIVYPCNENKTLNFVGIHPEEESHATRSDEWDKNASVDQVLKVYGDFDPLLKRMLSMPKAGEIKVWKLLDMAPLPTWTKGKLALMGDAAHPFTPHQGQGASQAIEDAAALATVLPLGTAPSEVPKRLKLYDDIRRKRADIIQDYSRQAGRDWVDGRPGVDMTAFAEYNFGHDEIDNSRLELRKWRAAANGQQDIPLLDGLGPLPTASQQPSYTGEFFSLMTVSFQTSRTYLDTLLPTPRCSFPKRDTVCTASYVVLRTRDSQSEKSAKGTTTIGLLINGVRDQSLDGASDTYSYLPLTFESHENDVSSEHRDIGLPEMHCDVDAGRGERGWWATAACGGPPFFEIKAWNEASEPDLEAEPSAWDYTGFPIRTYRHVEGFAGESHGSPGLFLSVENSRPGAIDRVVRYRDASLKFDPEAVGSGAATALHQSVGALVDVPIFKVTGAVLLEGRDSTMFSTCCRLGP